MAATKPPYAPQFREQMVELYRVGRKASELAKEFGCSEQSILNWVARAAADRGKPVRGKDVLASAEREELSRLRRENRQLRQERDILANRLRGAPRPLAKKHSEPRLSARLDSRPLAFWRFTTP